jgi:hypothetical protein
VSAAPNEQWKTDEAAGAAANTNGSSKMSRNRAAHQKNGASLVQKLTQFSARYQASAAFKFIGMGRALYRDMYAVQYTNSKNGYSTWLPITNYQMASSK